MINRTNSGEQGTTFQECDGSGRRQAAETVGDDPGSPVKEKVPGLTLQMERLVQIMGALRDPGGCPWDREQTMGSLKPCILEEAYELIEAIETGEASSISEESGDLLLQVVFISQLAMEEGLFDLAGVLRGLNEKLIRRHPHVFGDQTIETSDGVKQNWDRIKQGERKKKLVDSSVFAGIPRNIPALVRSRQIQERAAKVGFDWDKGDIEPLLRKISEEIQELVEAISLREEEHIEEELGDLFFALVNLSRHLEIEAEFSLQKANYKFMERFRFIENYVGSSGRKWEDYSLDELEDIWQSAKKALSAEKA